MSVFFLPRLLWLVVCACARVRMESVRHGVAIGDASAEPSSYMHEYTLPVHREKLLQKLFKHERDDDIVFYEKPHIYTIYGRFIDASVSGLIKDFTEEFNPDKIIQKMITSKSQKWPRKKYCINVEKIDSLPAQGNVLCVDSKEMTVFSGPVQDADNTFLDFEKYEIYSYDRGMTPDEIKEQWDSPEARNRGTEAHYMMELWMNSDPCRLEQPEVKAGLKFVESQLVPNKIQAYRTEWEIFAEEENLAGSVDFVGTFPDGSLVIVDWKRSDKLATHMRDHWNKKLKWPMNHLDDCDGAKYAIQLSSYAWILEKYYGKTVKALALCSLHPDAPFHTWVPYLKDEVEYLMKKCRERFANKLTLEATNTSLPRCSLSGKIPYDAVRMENGDLCCEKLLLIRDDCQDNYYADYETRRRCKEELLQVTVSQPCQQTRNLEERAVKWKERMPNNGIQEIFSF